MFLTRRCLSCFFFVFVFYVPVRKNPPIGRIINGVEGKKSRERGRDVSFIYPHASVLLVKEGRTMAASPNLLSVSPCFAIDFSDKVQNHFSTPLHPPLPLSLTLFIISSHISARSLSTLRPSWMDGSPRSRVYTTLTCVKCVISVYFADVL